MHRDEALIKISEDLGPSIPKANYPWASQLPNSVNNFNVCLFIFALANNISVSCH